MYLYKADLLTMRARRIGDKGSSMHQILRILTHSVNLKWKSEYIVQVRFGQFNQIVKSEVTK